MRAGMLVFVVLVAVAAADREAMVATQAAGQPADVVATTREALGGEARFQALTALAVEGRFRRGTTQQVDGTLKVTLSVPGRMRHEEDLNLRGGARVLRLFGLNGDHVWEDTASRGGPGGQQIVIRGGTRSLGDESLDSDERREAQRRRATAVYQRLALALYAVGDDLSYVGVAEVGDGEVDVLEMTDSAGHPLRLFVGRDTHLPVAISFMEVRPDVGGQGMGMTAPGPARPPGRGTRQLSAPPPTTIVMRLEDYRAVDGLMLPHLFVQTFEGEPIEEWTVGRYQLNPRLRGHEFDRR